MALTKRLNCKDIGSIDQPVKQLDDIENNKRKKRSNRDDESYKHEEILFLPQKKRVLGPPAPNNTNRLQHNGRQNSAEDQDDETLIRETQAALKSLSGSWAGGSLYKINDQDENPTFQNLFEEKNANRKMSPTISTTTANNTMTDAQYKDEYAFKDFNSKCRNDMKSLHKFRRDEFIAQQQRYKDKQHIVSQYQSHDFTELVDDSSNELHIDMAVANKDENNHQLMRRDYHKADSMYLPYLAGNRPTFSQSSAFKPLAENRKNSMGLGVGVGVPYSTETTYVGYSNDSHVQHCGSGITENSDISVSDKEKLIMKSQIKEENTTKPIDSPDSKHYTILQPAGVGSKAASVMQDIAREGVVSVAAVSSTSSPGLGSVSSTTVGEKPSYIDRMVPAFSPGSINRGNYTHTLY